MPSVFQSVLWQITIPSPWKTKECEHCIELTQPEGIGAIHISGAQKTNSAVLDSDTFNQLTSDCPPDTGIQKAQVGDFKGYSAEYVDWNDNAYWKKWFVACRKTLLFVTYNCKRGEEDLEAKRVTDILNSLRCRE